MRFAYVYFMKEQPERIQGVAPEHAGYWRGLALPGYLGGPFGDRSGGLILFEADSIDQAERFASKDPFIREDVLQSHRVKEWRPDDP